MKTRTELLLDFVGQKHIWITLIVAFLLAFGYANPEDLERWGEVLAGWVATARCN